MKTKNDQIQLNDSLSYVVRMIYIKDMKKQLISYGSAFLIPFLFCLFCINNCPPWLVIVVPIATLYCTSFGQLFRLCIRKKYFCTMLCGVFSSAIYVIGTVRLMQIMVPLILFRIVAHQQALIQYFYKRVKLYNQNFCTLVELYNQKARLTKLLCNNDGSSLFKKLYQEFRSVSQLYDDDYDDDAYDDAYDDDDDAYDYDYDDYDDE